MKILLLPLLLLSALAQADITIDANSKQSSVTNVAYGTYKGAQIESKITITENTGVGQLTAHTKYGSTSVGDYNSMGRLNEKKVVTHTTPSFHGFSYSFSTGVDAVEYSNNYVMLRAATDQSVSVITQYNDWSFGYSSDKSSFMAYKETKLYRTATDYVGISHEFEDFELYVETSIDNDSSDTVFGIRFRF